MDLDKTGKLFQDNSLTAPQSKLGVVFQSNPELNSVTQFAPPSGCASSWQTINLTTLPRVKRANRLPPSFVDGQRKIISNCKSGE